MSTTDRLRQLTDRLVEVSGRRLELRTREGGCALVEVPGGASVTFLTPWLSASALTRRLEEMLQAAQHEPGPGSETTGVVYELDLDSGRLTPRRMTSEAVEATKETIRKLGAAARDWCDCEDSELGYYPSDGECVCGLFKHHTHCRHCGRLTQVG